MKDAAVQKMAVRKAARRKIPYDKIARLWSQGKTISEIARAIRRVGQGDDPFHSVRVILTKMHRGFRDKGGKLVKLPHRINAQTLRRASRAGRQGRK